MTLSRPVGWEKDSFAYHGDDGRSFCGGAHDKNYGKEYGKTGDVIGCGINFTDGTVWFTRNGAALGMHISVLSFVAVGSFLLDHLEICG